MRVRYNVTGNERKALVKIISDTTGEKAIYRFMPTCNFDIGSFTVTKDGTLLSDEEADSELAQKVIEALATAGFKGEALEGTEKATEEAAPAATETDSATEAAPDKETTGLTVSLPIDGFTESAIENLRKLIDSKATLIRKALAADRLTVEVSEDRVSFPWFDTLPEPEETQAIMSFIAALCSMAKDAKRVTSTEKGVESEKYAFRCFLLRLGFIGAESKAQRKILMSRLSGSAAFRNKAEADKFAASQKAKREAAKAAEVMA